MRVDDLRSPAVKGADLSCRGVGVRFEARQITALSHLDLHIAAGEHVAILGASGSGKTTLLRVLVGAIAFTGAIQVQGLNPMNHRDRQRIRRQTGVLRQGTDLVPCLSGRLNAVMGCAPDFSARDWLALSRSRVPPRLADRLADLASSHGIEDCLDARVSDLSGGQRQRVALIRALLSRPRLLLADEPTTGLDPVAAHRAADYLLACKDATVLVATHDLDVARRFPRVIGLVSGRVVQDAASLDSQMAAELYGGRR